MQLTSVRPTVEEVQKFLLQIERNQEEDKSDDEGKVLREVKKQFLGGNAIEIAKGDKIKILEGDLKNLTGEVVAIEEGFVIFKPDIQGFDQNLKVELSHITKFFEPGDAVRVIKGTNKGETGLVIDSEDKFTNVVLD